MLRGLRRAGTRNYLLFKKLLAKMFPPSVPVSDQASDKVRIADDLAEQVVIITGSTRGIGLALAHAFAGAGARVVINGRNQEALDKALRQLQSAHADVLGVLSDVSTAEGSNELIEKSVARFGYVSVLINNAGIPGSDDKAIWDVPSDEWRNVLDVNVSGPFHCAREIINWSREHEQPVRVINVSSGVVGHGAHHLGPYGVSKMGLEGLTLAIAADSADVPEELVSVVSIQPRSVRSKMTQQYFSASDYALMDEPEAVTDVFLYAATAPVGEIMGKTICEPVFAADRLAAVTVKGALASAQPIAIHPETYRADLQPAGIDQPGAYMHLLENPAGFYQSAHDALESQLGSRKLYCYPDPDYPELRSVIAQRHEIDTGQIALGAGSTELIDRILRTFCGAGDQIIITKPTWSFFMAFFRRWGLHPIQVPHLGSMSDKNMRHDLGRILDEVNWRTRLIYLVNPCNPTGAVIDKDELKDFLQNVPAHVTVMLDEAYIDYCDPDKRFELSEVLDQVPARVIGIRTFSKFFALSGLRVGYAYARPETINLLERSGIPFNVSSVAQLAATAVLHDENWQKQTYQNNLTERHRICAELDRLKIGNQPSQTNFILFDCPLSQDKLRGILYREGLVMPNVQQFLQNYAVMPVGLPEHNQLILEALSQY